MDGRRLQELQELRRVRQRRIAQLETPSYRMMVGRVFVERGLRAA